MASEQEALLAMHEHIFDILYKKYQEDNSFLFTIETSEKELKEGNYFTVLFPMENRQIAGNLFIRLSFWHSKLDISFNLDVINNKYWFDIYIILQNDFFKELSHSLSKTKGQLQIDKESTQLKKYYPSLEDFLEHGKEIIDNLIRKENERKANFPITFLDKKNFELNLNKVIAARKERMKFSNGIIKLKTLKLSNIGRFSEEIKIDFSKQVTCIIGENGSGKSTILRALGVALSGVNNSPLLKSSEMALQNLIQIKGEANPSDKGMMSVDYELIAPNETLNFTQKVAYKTEFSLTEMYKEGDFANMSDPNHFKTLTIGFPQVHGKKINETNGQLDSKRGNLKDILPLILNESDNRFEILSEWIANLFAAGNNEIVHGTEKPKQHEIIAKMFEIISAVTESSVEFMCVIYDGFGSGKRVWVKTEDSPNGIPLSLISQGYNNIFGWIGFLIKRIVETNPILEDFTQAHAIVLIDEIDTYLHPKWQRTILATLAKSFPNVQFIVTTHSPLVLATLDNAKSVVYEVENGKISEIKHFYGRRIQDILNQYYGIKERPSMEINKYINTLEEAMLEEDATQIELELSKLIPILGEDDPLIWDAKAYLEKSNANI